MQSWRMEDTTSRAGSFGRLRWQFALGQHVCIWAARLHKGSTFASGQHVCIWAARLHLRHREPVQSLNAAGGRTLVGFRRSTRAEEMLEIVACA